MNGAVALPDVAARGPAPSTAPALPVDANQSALLTFALYAYLGMYVFEGPFRYALNMAGLDSAIFIRDALVFLGIFHVVLKQMMVGKVNKFMVIFLLLLVFEGVIGAANLHQVTPVLAGFKVFFSVLIGAFCAARLIASRPAMLRWLTLLWLVGFVSAGVEKYAVDWPWTGLKVEIGDTVVEASHDWQLGATNKRAAGFTRSSIHLASFISVVGLLLFYSANGVALRLAIATISTVTIFWTTQKGALLAFVIVLVVSFVPERLRMSSLKWLFLLFVILMIGMPLLLPGYVMPSGEEGVFSLQSFYDRIMRMWPDAWVWLDQRGTPLFGVGLGGIGIAMRLYTEEAAFYAPNFASYAPYLINYADNMFVYLYVQFGVMSFFYIGYVMFGVSKLSSSYDANRAKALSVLVFLVGYGVAVSIIEDQIGCIMLGATCYYLCADAFATAATRLRKTEVVPVRSAQPVAVPARKPVLGAGR